MIVILGFGWGPQPFPENTLRFNHAWIGVDESQVVRYAKTPLHYLFIGIPVNVTDFSMVFAKI